MELLVVLQKTISGFSYILVAFLLWTASKIFVTAFDHELRKIPGQRLSAYTGIPLKVASLTGRRTLYIHALHEQYGPYVRIAPREIAIADIEACRLIHRVGSDFHKGQWYQGQVPSQCTDATSGVFCIQSNKTASFRRRLFQTAGTKKCVAEWEPQVIELTSLAVEKIKQELEKNGEADVMKWWTFMASDVTGSLAFGDTFNSTQKGEKSQFVHDIEACMPLIGLRSELRWTRPIMDYLMPRWLPGSPISLLDRLESYGQAAVRATRAAQQGGNKTLFSKMIPEDAEEQTVPDSVAEKEASNVIVAGTDTTAMTLTYLVYRVLQNPDVKQKLVEELKRFSVSPKWDELESMPYLSYVIQETWRLHPAAPASLARVVPKGVEMVGKYRMPAGTQVDTQAWTFQRDPNVFEDPLTFNPSRWADATPLMKEHMMVFGGAARMCIGQNIAKLMILHAVSTFFRISSDVALHPNTTAESMEMVDYFAIKPKGGKCLVVQA